MKKDRNKSLHQRYAERVAYHDSYIRNLTPTQTLLETFIKIMKSTSNVDVLSCN